MVNAFLSTLFLYNKHIFLRSISLFASILFTFIIFSLIASSIYHGSFLNVSRSWFAHLQRSSRLKSLPAVSTYSAFRSILLAVFSPRLRYHRISLRIDITSSMLCILIQYSFNCWSLSFFFSCCFLHAYLRLFNEVLFHAISATPFSQLNYYSSFRSSPGVYQML